MLSCFISVKIPDSFGKFRRLRVSSSGRLHKNKQFRVLLSLLLQNIKPPAMKLAPFDMNIITCAIMTFGAKKTPGVGLDKVVDRMVPSNSESTVLLQHF
jgi:hypothetical protein